MEGARKRYDATRFDFSREILSVLHLGDWARREDRDWHRIVASNDTVRRIADAGFHEASVRTACACVAARELSTFHQVSRRAPKNPKPPLCTTVIRSARLGGQKLGSRWKNAIRSKKRKLLLDLHRSRSYRTFLDTFDRFVAERARLWLLERSTTSSNKVGLVYQRPPTLRVQFADGKAATIGLHRDADYPRHDGREVNLWIPISTRVFDSNSLYVESEPDRGDFSAVCMENGSALVFKGYALRHYTKPNDTKFTRVSFDFRAFLLQEGATLEDHGGLIGDYPCHYLDLRTGACRQVPTKPKPFKTRGRMKETKKKQREAAAESRVSSLTPIAFLERFGRIRVLHRAEHCVVVDKPSELPSLTTDCPTRGRTDMGHRALDIQLETKRFRAQSCMGLTKASGVVVLGDDDARLRVTQVIFCAAVRCTVNTSSYAHSIVRIVSTIWGKEGSLILVAVDPRTVDGSVERFVRKALNKHQNQIIGDPRGGKSRLNRYVREKYGYPFMALHAMKVRLVDDADGKERVFRAELPSALISFLSRADEFEQSGDAVRKCVKDALRTL
eukprot:g773.t1